jgi:DnaJ-class molecular chaperone
MSDFTELVAQLDYRCPTCSGAGGWGIPQGFQVCHVCEGVGHILTAQGRALIEWLGRHGIRPEEAE